MPEKLKRPCVKCGTFRRSLHRDHVIPRWKGGPDEESNIQLLCANCHEDKTWDERIDPEYRVIVGGRISATLRRPEIRAKYVAAGIRSQASPEVRQRMRERALTYWRSVKGLEA